MNLNLKLTLEQVNVIMGALGDAPYKTAAPVINEIQTQAQSQMQPQLVPQPEQTKEETA